MVSEPSLPQTKEWKRELERLASVSMQAETEDCVTGSEEKRLRLQISRLERSVFLTWVVGGGSVRLRKLIGATFCAGGPTSFGFSGTVGVLVGEILGEGTGAGSRG